MFSPAQLKLIATCYEVCQKNDVPNPAVRFITMGRKNEAKCNGVYVINNGDYIGKSSAANNTIQDRLWTHNRVIRTGTSTSASKPSQNWINYHKKNKHTDIDSMPVLVFEMTGYPEEDIALVEVAMIRKIRPKINTDCTTKGVKA